MLRFGIVGCGRAVEWFHLPAWRALEGQVHLVALADPIARRLEVVGRAAGVPAGSRYGDHRQMLRSETLDFVVVAAPPREHETVVLDCATAGRHVLLEKPMVLSLESADNLLARTERAGVRLGIVHNYRYRPHYQEALRLIRAGAIGMPFLVRLEEMGRGHFQGAEEFDPDWRTRRSVAGGGCVLDKGYHSFYLAEAFQGAPVAMVYAQMGTFQPGLDVEDLGVVTLTHAHQGISAIQVAWSAPGGGQLVEEVHGTEGSVAFWREGRAISVYSSSRGTWEPLPVDVRADALGFAGAFRDFVAALEEGREPPASAREARRTLALVLAAYRSSRTGQVVEVPDELRD